MGVVHIHGLDLSIQSIMYNPTTLPLACRWCLFITSALPADMHSNFSQSWGRGTEKIIQMPSMWLPFFLHNQFMQHLRFKQLRKHFVNFITLQRKKRNYWVHHCGGVPNPRVWGQGCKTLHSSSSQQLGKQVRGVLI